MNETRKFKYLKIITKNSRMYNKTKINPKIYYIFNKFPEIATAHAADDGGGRQNIIYNEISYLYGPD